MTEFEALAQHTRIHSGVPDAQAGCVYKRKTDVPCAVCMCSNSSASELVRSESDRYLANPECLARLHIIM